MPYKSKRKRLLYARKWRHTHPSYMTEHGRAYREGVPATCLLGRRTNAPDATALAPLPNEIARPANFALVSAK